MAIPFPYTVQTTKPDLEYEEFEGAKFGYVLWKVAEGAPKARLLLVHGFGEYTTINSRLMDHLALAGYESFTFDQRGSGVTSPGKLKGLTNEYHTFKDLDHFIEKNLKECGNLPLYLWGHSMGGAIILNYACHGKYREKIAGYIASGPLIILHPHSKPNKLTEWISPMLAKCLGKHRIDTGLDLDGITADPRYREFLQNDKPMSIPMYGSFEQIYDFLERGKRLYNDTNGLVSKKYPKDKPVLVQHGQGDTINDPKGSEKFIELCPSTDKTLKTYKNARHSILSLETDESFNLVFSDLKKWLDAHTTSQSKL
ncbi:Monoglyceride lipase [Nakaseomyces bracarensis]|uniref:Monoglyceride lipase n=1 Tax=Nakaseomyces bracarensis TaxID=273131 RepID=A0ABR4NZT8_9SACH